MIKKIDHIVITTSDIEKCTKFYQLLGFTLRDSGDRYELFAGNFKINVHIKGRELLPHAQNVQVGSADLCFELEGKLDKFQEGILGKGIAVELGVVDRTGANGPMKSIYLRDPDGNLVEFCSYE